MVDLRLLGYALLAVLAVLVVVTFIIVTHAALHQLHAGAERRRLREARALLAGALTKRGHVWGGRFRRLPWDIQRRVFIEAGRALAGSDLKELENLAAEAGLFDRAARETRRRHWSRRLAGARLFSAVGGGEGTMPVLLGDPHPMVRAEAIQWARDHLELIPVERLLDRLDTDSPYERLVLIGTLIEIGVPAVAPLARYLRTARGSGRVAGLEVAVGLADGRLADAALAAARDTEPRVRAQSAAVLGRIGGEAAIPALVDMLDDHAAPVRREAATALGHIGAWSAATQIAGLLDDNDRMTRQAAALALHALGGPGRLVCRSLIDTGTPRVSALARSILALPRGGREVGA